MVKEKHDHFNKTRMLLFLYKRKMAGYPSHVHAVRISYQIGHLGMDSRAKKNDSQTEKHADRLTKERNDKAEYRL